MEFLTNILTGNIGTAIIALILWRSGLLKELLGKNGNGDKGQKLADEVAEVLATNHFHELVPTLNRINDTLGRIEKGQEKHDEKEMPILQDISKGITYLEAKSNHIKHE